MHSFQEFARKPNQLAPTDNTYVPAKAVAPFIEVARQVRPLVPGLSTPFIMIDKDALTQQVARWQKHLPGQTPHYAIKANDFPPILRHFQQLGISFDAATGGEIEKLIRLGVPGEKIVCTHPVRGDRDFDAVVRHRPGKLVVQDVKEICELRQRGVPNAAYHPDIYVRIALPFSNLNKFGVEAFVIAGDSYAIDHRGVLAIFEEAAKSERILGAKFGECGLAGHAGTNEPKTNKFRMMLGAFTLLSQNLADCGYPITRIDMGGGYADQARCASANITQDKQLAEIAKFINNQFIPKFRGPVEIIAEPGRFMVSNAMAVFAGIKRVNTHESWIDNGVRMNERNAEIHLNHGVYGLLMGQVHDEKLNTPTPHRASGAFKPEYVPCLAWGDTCDTFDKLKLAPGFGVPADIRAGDELVFDNAGAYSIVTATEFNSTDPATALMFERTPDGIVFEHYDLKGEPLSSGSTRVPAPDLSQVSFGNRVFADPHVVGV